MKLAATCGLSSERRERYGVSAVVYDADAAVLVVAQVSRSPRQVQLRRFLTGCTIVPLGESEAHEAGQLLGMTGTSDVVDAAVVTIARRQKAIILTGDPHDIQRLAGASGHEIAVVAV